MDNSTEILDNFIGTVKALKTHGEFLSECEWRVETVRAHDSADLYVRATNTGICPRRFMVLIFPIDPKPETKK